MPRRTSSQAHGGRSPFPPCAVHLGQLRRIDPRPPYERRRELRKDQSVLIFVGYATGSDQPERRFTAAAAAELGIRSGDYTAVETR